jgi:hypothetical protein
MTSGIYLIQNDGELVAMTAQPYDSEALLQGLLASYPSLLAGDQIDTSAPRRWLLVSRETPIPAMEGGAGRWAVDHLFLDQDGIPTLVEVKRSTDTRIRREVVGQMLDYAANAVVYWPVETIRSQFEATCAKNNQDPSLELAAFLGPDADSDAFWHQVKTNLQAGKIRMIFIADEIPTELQRIVEFLNQQMDPAEVLAVEIKQFVGQQLRTLVPRVIGQTAAAQQIKAGGSRPGRQWDETSFFQELETKQGAEVARVARSIVGWARPRVSRVWWGEGKTLGSFVPVLNHKDRDHQMFAVWTNGTIEIYFYWFQFKPAFDSEEKRLELLERLNGIEGIRIPRDAITRRPTFPLVALRSEATLRQFFAVFEWFIQEVRAS